MADEEDILEEAIGDFDDYVSDLEAAEEEELDDEDSEAEEEEDDAELGLLEGEEPESAEEEVGELGALLGVEERKERPGRLARGKTVQVLPPERYITSDYLTTYEISQILAQRSEQIGKYNNVFLPEGVARESNDPVKLAMQELKCGMNPFIIQRKRSHGLDEVVERRAVRDLLIPPALVEL